MPPLPSPVVLVAGTWGSGYGRNGDWWRPGSGFSKMLAGGGVPLLDQEDPFQWSTEVDGVNASNLVWQTAGRALKWYCEAKAKRGRPSIIAHSHGGQVAAIAASAGAKFDTVVTVATPVREDLDPQYQALRANSRRWVQIYTDEAMGGGWQLMGAIGLANLFKNRIRYMPFADENLYCPGRSHGDLVGMADLWLPAPAGQGWRGLLCTVPLPVPGPTTADPGSSPRPAP